MIRSPLRLPLEGSSGLVVARTLGLGETVDPSKAQAVNQNVTNANVGIAANLPNVFFFGGRS